MSVTRLVQNNGASPWSFTDFDGMRLAMLVTWIWGERFNVTEKYILVVLYAARVKGADLIDHRVTYKRLAQHCGVSVPTVERVMRKFRKLGLVVVDQEATGQEAQYLSVPFDAIDILVERNLGHTPHRGYE